MPKAHLNAKLPLRQLCVLLILIFTSAVPGHAVHLSHDRFHFIYRITFSFDPDTVTKIVLDLGPGVSPERLSTSEMGEVNKYLNNNTLIDCYGDSSIVIARYVEDVPTNLRSASGVEMVSRGAKLNLTRVVDFGKHIFYYQHLERDGKLATSECFSIDTTAIHLIRTGHRKKIGRWNCIEFKAALDSVDAYIYAAQALPQLVNPAVTIPGLNYGLVRLSVGKQQLDLIQLDRTPAIINAPPICRNPGNTMTSVNLFLGIIAYFNKVVSGQRR